MADIVLDENGNELDKEGKKKKSLNADYMSKADVLAIVSGFASNFDSAAAALDKICCGTDYTAGCDALKNLSTAISGGAHIEFARKNAWISDAAQKSKYLTMGGDQGIADKELVCDFYTLVVKTKGIRTEFAKLLEDCISFTLFKAYSAVRYEVQMKEIVKPDDIAALSFAFLEYDNIYKTFNNASIYDTMPVNKSRMSAADIQETVLDYLDAAVCGKPHLGQLLLGASKAAPSVMNRLYIYDRETKAYDKFACRRDNLQHCLDFCAEIEGKVGDAYVLLSDGLTDYLRGYNKVLQKLMTLLKKAIDVIDEFQTNKNTAPYSIMHYDAYVKDVTSKYYLGTLTDPITRGTNYFEIAQNMIESLRHLAKSIAKNAPM